MCSRQFMDLISRFPNHRDAIIGLEGLFLNANSQYDIERIYDLLTLQYSSFSLSLSDLLRILQASESLGVLKPVYRVMSKADPSVGVYDANSLDELPSVVIDTMGDDEVFKVVPADVSIIYSRSGF